MTRHDIPFYRVPVSRGGWGQPICTIEWSSPRVPLNLEGDFCSFHKSDNCAKPEEGGWQISQTSFECWILVCEF